MALQDSKKHTKSFLGRKKFLQSLPASSVVKSVLIDILHGCVINYVIKSQRDGLENYEIQLFFINTSSFPIKYL